MERELKSLARTLSENTFSVIAELPVHGSMSFGEIVRQAKTLSPFVDAVQVVENPARQGQMSAVALASLLLNEGIDPVAQLNCRDCNRRALHRDLSGLKALGVTSIVLNRGNQLQHPGKLDGKPVFDVNCCELIKMAAEIGEGQPARHGTDFMIGTGATVFSPGPDWKAELLKSRARAGARFLFTQPCFSVSMLRRYAQRLVDLKLTWRYAVIVTLAPLPGMEVLRWQFEDARGTIIPVSLMKKLAETDDPEQLGIEICARQIKEISEIPGISGVNLMTLGNPSAVKAAIEMSGVRRMG